MYMHHLYLHKKCILFYLKSILDMIKDYFIAAYLLTVPQKTALYFCLFHISHSFPMAIISDRKDYKYDNFLRPYNLT